MKVQMADYYELDNYGNTNTDNDGNVYTNWPG